MAILLERANTEFLSRASAPSILAAVAGHVRVRFNAVDVKQTIWYIDSGTDDTGAIRLTLNADATLHLVRFSESGSTEFDVAAAGTYSTGVDYEWMIVRPSGALPVWAVYQNGNATPIITSPADGVTAGTAARLSFGASPDGFDAVDGSISDLGAWTAALNTTQIAAVSSGSCAAVTANAWGRWTANTHTAITDSSGNGRDLTATGTLSTVTDPVVPGGGSNVTVTPTGFGLTSSLGSPSISRTGQISPTGFGLSMSLGTPTTQNDITRIPNGFQLTSSLGAPQVNGGVSIAPSGFGLTTTLGTFDIRNDITMLVPGFGLAVSLGTPTYSETGGSDATVSPTGFGLTASIGSPTLAFPVQTIVPGGFQLEAQLGSPTWTGATSAAHTRNRSRRFMGGA